MVPVLLSTALSMKRTGPSKRGTATPAAVAGTLIRAGKPLGRFMAARTRPRYFSGTAKLTYRGRTRLITARLVSLVFTTVPGKISLLPTTPLNGARMVA